MQITELCSDIVELISLQLPLPDILNWKLTCRHFNTELSLFDNKLEARILYHLGKQVIFCTSRNYARDAYVCQRDCNYWYDACEDSEYDEEGDDTDDTDDTFFPKCYKYNYKFMEEKHRGKKQQKDNEEYDDNTHGLPWYVFYNMLSRLDRGREWLEHNDPEWMKKYFFPKGVSLWALCDIYLENTEKYQCWEWKKGFIFLYQHIYHKDDGEEKYKQLSIHQTHIFTKVGVKVNNSIRDQYYNKERMLLGVVKKEEKENLPCDLKLLNALESIYNYEYGFYLDDDLDKIFFLNSKGKHPKIKEVLDKILNNEEGIEKYLDKKCFDTERFYLTYNFNYGSYDCPKLLSIFSKNGKYTTYGDIISNIWTFRAPINNGAGSHGFGYGHFDYLLFYGWKDDIPIIEVKSYEPFPRECYDY